VSLLPKTVNMIMAISQRVFVGEPLCRSEEWVGAFMGTPGTTLMHCSSTASCKSPKRLSKVSQHFGIVMRSYDLSSHGATQTYARFESIEREQNSIDSSRNTFLVAES